MSLKLEGGMVVAGILMVLALFLMGVGEGYRYSRRDFQLLAVKHHAAHWEVKDDGSTTFKWNDEK